MNLEEWRRWRRWRGLVEVGTTRKCSCGKEERDMEDEGGSARGRRTNASEGGVERKRDDKRTNLQGSRNSEGFSLDVFSRVSVRLVLDDEVLRVVEFESGDFGGVSSERSGEEEFLALQTRRKRTSRTSR